MIVASHKSLRTVKRQMGKPGAFSCPLRCFSKNDRRDKDVKTYIEELHVQSAVYTPDIQRAEVILTPHLNSGQWPYVDTLAENYRFVLVTGAA